MVTNILAFKQQLVAATHKYHYRHRFVAGKLRVISRLKCTLEFKWCSK